MDSLVITILIIIVCLVLFGLVYVNVEYQELERRFNLIALRKPVSKLNLSPWTAPS